MSEKIDKIVGAYVQARDHLSVLKKAHEAQVAPIKEKMKKLEAWLLLQSNNQGVQSFNTPLGTAYKVKEEFIGVADWNAALQYALDNDLTHMLTHSFAKTKVLEYMKENNGELPPGLNYTSSYKINIQRPRAKK